MGVPIKGESVDGLCSEFFGEALEVEFIVFLAGVGVIFFRFVFFHFYFLVGLIVLLFINFLCLTVIQIIYSFV